MKPIIITDKWFTNVIKVLRFTDVIGNTKAIKVEGHDSHGVLFLTFSNQLLAGHQWQVHQSQFMYLMMMTLRTSAVCHVSRVRVNLQWDLIHN